MQVTIKTLRHYEQKELLIPEEVDEWTGYRYYSIGQMQKLTSIRQLQQLGFTLEEIKDLYAITLWGRVSKYPSGTRKGFLPLADDVISRRVLSSMWFVVFIL